MAAQGGLRRVLLRAWEKLKTRIRAHPDSRYQSALPSNPTEYRYPSPASLPHAEFSPNFPEKSERLSDQRYFKRAQGKRRPVEPVVIIPPTPPPAAAPTPTPAAGQAPAAAAAPPPPPTPAPAAPPLSPEKLALIEKARKIPDISWLEKSPAEWGIRANAYRFKDVSILEVVEETDLVVK